MRYTNIKKAEFLSRPNRFIARVTLNGEEVVAHVKNTGRCRELLTEGATVYLEEPTGKTRKTKYDLVAVEKSREAAPSLLINMDSSAPNDAVAEWLPKSGLFSANAAIRREVTKGSSRFDFMIDDCGRTTYLEVKGVTLEERGIASFPDAPTERGVKHIEELTALAEENFGAIILFVIQMKGVTELRPNDRTHKAFGDALRRAAEAGVRILAYDCVVTDNSMEIDAPVTVNLANSNLK